MIEDFKKWLGKDGISYFRHLKGLTGTYSPVLSLNVKRKGTPVYPVHFREGITVRNWMRTREEFKDSDLDSEWINLIEKACEL